MSEQIGKYRPAKNIKPGWHIRTLDEHGKPSWHEAALVMETSNPVTDAKYVRVACTDGVVSSCGAADEAMCRTLAEVRQADTDRGGR